MCADGFQIFKERSLGGRGEGGSPLETKSKKNKEKQTKKNKKKV
jgi:hypothetical protein